MKNGVILTWNWHVGFNIIREEDSVYALPLVFLALILLTSFLAFESSLLVLVKAFKWWLFSYFAATGIALMFPEGNIVCKSRAAAMTLWRKDVATIEMFPTFVSTSYSAKHRRGPSRHSMLNDGRTCKTYFSLATVVKPGSRQDVNVGCFPGFRL